jgi:hypothetical protein
LIGEAVPAVKLRAMPVGRATLVLLDDYGQGELYITGIWRPTLTSPALPSLCSDAGHLAIRNITYFLPRLSPEEKKGLKAGKARLRAT